MIRLIDERIMEKLRDEPENINYAEFASLVHEWREEPASTSKCPYCVKPIEKQAIKCNHCLSEIQWFKENDLYGPCRAGSAAEMKKAITHARITYRAMQAAERAALAKEEENKAKHRTSDEQVLADKKKELANEKCIQCGNQAFPRQETEFLSGVQLYDWQIEARVNKQYRCRPCLKRKMKKDGCVYLIIGFIVAPILAIILWNL